MILLRHGRRCQLLPWRQFHDLNPADMTLTAGVFNQLRPTPVSSLLTRVPRCCSRCKSLPTPARPAQQVHCLDPS